MSELDPPVSSAVEQRTSVRRPVLYRLDVTDTKGGLFGYLVDLSSGGMRVRCVPGMDVEAAEELCILLPQWMELGDSLTFRGRFAWARPFGDGRTEGGFVFKGSREATMERLESLLDRIAEAAVEDSDL